MAEKKIPIEQPTVPTWVEANPTTVTEPTVAPVDMWGIQWTGLLNTPTETVNPVIQAIRNAKLKAQTPTSMPAGGTPPTQAPLSANNEPQPITQQPAPIQTQEAPKVESTTIKAPELTDAEKAAQATWLQYTNIGGQIKYMPKTLDEAKKVLTLGGSFAGESKLTAQAKANLDNLRRLSGLNDAQLADYITQGKVSSSDISQLQAINPNLVAQAQQKAKNSSIAEVNNNAMSVYGKGEITYKNTALDNLNKTLAKIDSNGGYAQVKKEVFAQYPEMQNLRQNITKTSIEIRGIQEAMRKQADDLKERFKGLPMSTILAMASTKNKPLTDQLYALQDQLTLDSSEYNAQLDQAKSEIEYTLQDKQKKEERALFLYWKTRDEEIRQEDFVRADKKLADEIARDDKKDLAKTKALEQERLDNVKEAIAKLGGTPTGTTYDELLGEYAKAAKIQNDREFALKNAPSSSDYIKSNDANWDEIYINVKTGQKITPSQFNSLATPTGNLVSVNTGNKNVQVDSVAAPWLQAAIEAMKASGINVVTWQGARDQAQTIKEMWDRYGMPWATAAQLRAAWHQVADVGKSNHETGLAIDIYNNNTQTWPTQEMINIMKQNWWRQGNAQWPIPWDAGHFEYVWVQNAQEKPLSDKQFTQLNQTKTSFKSEPIVKTFEEALTNWGGIIASLNSANWPWDVGAVFQFMKTLDPTSTVREGEFQLAAKSAGVWEQFKNIPANKLEGTILTPKQRQAFGKLAMEYIKKKGELYDVKYDDMKKTLTQQKIPESYLPTRMSDYIKNYAAEQNNQKNIFTSSIGWEASVDSNSIW